MSIEETEQQVLRWAYDRGIFAESTEVTRWEKFLEEVEELVDAIDPCHGDQDIDEIKLEAGDVLVTMINVLHPYGLDLETCLWAAYEKISKRTGKMVDGMFVKDKK